MNTDQKCQRSPKVHHPSDHRLAPSDEPKCTTPVITGSRSLCADFQEVIAPMLELGLSARRICQDLVAVSPA